MFWVLYSVVGLWWGPLGWSVYSHPLTHWGRVTHICVSKLTIIGSDNGLSPIWRQAIIWPNAGILLIGPLGTNFSEILSKFIHFHSRKWVWKCRLGNGGHFVSALMCFNPLWTGGLVHHYRKTSNISSTSAGNKIVDNSDVVGASPVGAAPTTSSFST